MSHWKSFLRILVSMGIHWQKVSWCEYLVYVLLNSNSLIEFIQCSNVPYLSMSDEGLVVSTCLGGAFVGSLLSGWVADGVGRRRAFQLSALPMIVGAAMRWHFLTTKGNSSQVLLCYSPYLHDFYLAILTFFLCIILTGYTCVGYCCRFLMFFLLVEFDFCLLSQQSLPWFCYKLWCDLYRPFIAATAMILSIWYS